MIQLIPVSDLKHLDDDLKQLYLDSFPADERRAWEAMQQLLTHPLFNVCRITHTSTFMGFITFWKWHDLLFIEHFALTEQARGKGFGTQMMEQIIKENSSTIVLEVELPLTEQATRRITFYQRLGFILCQQEYYQPPYNPGNEKIKMLIMSYPHILTTKDFAVIKKRLYKDVYKWDY